MGMVMDMDMDMRAARLASSSHCSLCKVGNLTQDRSNFCFKGQGQICISFPSLSLFFSFPPSPFSFFSPFFSSPDVRLHKAK